MRGKCVENNGNLVAGCRASAFSRAAEGVENERKRKDKMVLNIIGKEGRWRNNRL
jgi:hypothetical protein